MTNRAAWKPGVFSRAVVFSFSEEIIRSTNWGQRNARITCMSPVTLPRGFKSWRRHHTPERAPPPLNARKSHRRASRSVRPSTAAQRLPSRMRAARSQTARGIYLQEWDNTPDYCNNKKKAVSLSHLLFFPWQSLTNSLPSCLGLRRMWPKSRRAHTRWVRERDSELEEDFGACFGLFFFFLFFFLLVPWSGHIKRLLVELSVQVSVNKETNWNVCSSVKLN